MTCDGYLPLFGVVPVRSGVAEYFGQSWWYFEFKAVQSPFSELCTQLDLAESGTGASLTGDLTLWVDPATARLSKAVTLLEGRIFTHTFAAWGEPVEIFPPPFFVFDQSNSSLASGTR